MGKVRGRVEGPRSRGVVRGRVAEAAEDDRVIGPWGLDTGVAAQIEGVGEADCPGQVGGDGGGLGDDVQPAVTEDLVPPAGHRVARRRGQAEQDVADRGSAARDAARAA